MSAENKNNRNGEVSKEESLVESFNKHYTDYLERYSTNRSRLQPEEQQTGNTGSEPVSPYFVDTDDDDLVFTPEIPDTYYEPDNVEPLPSTVPSSEEEAVAQQPDDTEESVVENNESSVDELHVENDVAENTVSSSGESLEAKNEELSDESGEPQSAELMDIDDESLIDPEDFEDSEKVSLGDEEDDLYFSPEDAHTIADEEDALGFYEPENTPEPAKPEEPAAPQTVVEREVVREVIVVDRDQARDLGYAAEGYNGDSQSQAQQSHAPAPVAPRHTSPVFPTTQQTQQPAPVRVDRPISTERPVNNGYDKPDVVITSRPTEKSGFFGGLFKRGKDASPSNGVSEYVAGVSDYKERSRLREEGLDEDFGGTGDSNVISLSTGDNYDPREERRRLAHVSSEQRNVDPASWLEKTMLDALKMDASDLHIVVDGETKDLRARIRVDGQMQDFDYVTGVPAKVIMGRLKAATKLSSGGSFAPEETIYEIELDGEKRKARAVLFRVEDGGEALVMRLPLTGNLRQLDELAFSESNLQHVLDLLAMPYKLIMIAGPMGSGKGSPAWERILTPNGWTTYGEVAVGDFVVGSNGKATEVTGVFPRGELDVYKVTFNDGSSVTVDGDHLWSVQSPDDRHEGRGYRTVSTSELASNGLRNPKSNNAHKWFIPVVEPVQFSVQESALPVHPYVMGSLLGDGTFEGRGVGFSTVDAEFAAHVDERLPEGVSLRLLDAAPSRVGKCPHYNVVGDGKKNDLLRTFREMGMLGKNSVEKFVPEQYLYSSVEERLELLRGLMDSDGHAVKAAGAEFCSVSKNLADAVVFLTRSLGGVAKVTERTTSYTNKDGEKALGQLSYRVTVKLPVEFNPFRLARKADAWVSPTKYPVTRAISSIEPAGRDEVICIQVAAENSLYVADQFIVTHNTTTAHGALLHVASPERTVWTIEDPVERRLPNLVQLEIDEDNGAGFDVLLSKLLRADYNTLFLGEIRDNATAAAAVRQAKAGRQVMSTIHADDNIKSLMRLIELAGDSPMSVLSAVGGVISQRLVRKLNPNWDGQNPKEKYKGRLPIHEILFVNDTIVEVMMQDRPLSEIKQAVKAAKGSTFADDANRLINAGMTDREEVVKVIGEFDADDRY